MPTVWRSALPDIDPTPALLHEEVLGRAEQWPDRMAMADAATGRTLTYGQLADRARRLAGGLRAVGARPGEVLALATGNTLDFPVALHGALAAGLVVALVNPVLTARELASVLGRVRARYVVADDVAADGLGLPVATEAAAAREPGTVFAEVPAGDAVPIASLMEGEPLAPEPGDPAATALLFSTGGTGGLPKSAAHAHAAAVAALRQWDVSANHLAPEDVVSGALLFAHMSGTFVLNAALRAGARLATLGTFDLERFLRAVEDHQVTFAFGPPPLALALAHHPLVDRHDLSSLRTVATSAAPLPPAVQRACETRLGCAVGQGLGLTEGWAVAMPSRPSVHGSVGRLVASTEAVIVDPATGRRLDTGQTGELWVRGPQLMTGYVGDPEATAETIDADGWLHTGDLGYFDPDGNLFLTDRLKELIKHRGRQVAPAELEAELTSHPAVADAAVIPRQHPEAGEVPVAYVVLRAEVEPEALAAWLAERVAPWKRVWDVVVVDRLPRNPVGKLLRRILVEREREAGKRAGKAS